MLEAGLSAAEEAQQALHKPSKALPLQTVSNSSLQIVVVAFLVVVVVVAVREEVAHKTYRQAISHKHLHKDNQPQTLAVQEVVG